MHRVSLQYTFENHLLEIEKHSVEASVILQTSL